MQTATETHTFRCNDETCTAEMSVYRRMARWYDNHGMHAEAQHIRDTVGI